MYSEHASNQNIAHIVKDPLRKTNHSQFQHTSYSTQSGFVNTKPLMGMTGPIKPSNDYNG